MDEPGKTKEAVISMKKIYLISFAVSSLPFTVEKMSKAAVHSVKAPGKENIINLYFSVSVMIGNVTHVRSVLRLCVVLHYLWKSLVERSWKVFCCVSIHLYTCTCGYLAPKNY